MRWAIIAADTDIVDQDVERARRRYGGIALRALRHVARDCLRLATLAANRRDRLLGAGQIAVSAKHARAFTGEQGRDSAAIADRLTRRLRPHP